MNKSKRINMDYPYNLFDDVIKEEYGFIISDDQKAGLDAALKTLTEREQSTISLLYLQHLTLKDAGTWLGVGPERVRQINEKALRKLRHPSRKNLLLKGLETVELENEVTQLKNELRLLKNQLIGEKLRLMREGVTEEDIQNAEIMSINIIEIPNLSVRAFNCLKRANIETFGDLARFCCEHWANDPYGMYGLGLIRNMGRRSGQEVIGKVKAFGLDIPAYVKVFANEEEIEKE